MNFFRGILIILALYVSGIVLYSSLFILSANQLSAVQIAKIFVASLYCLIFIIPVFLAQSSHLILRVIGYAVLAAYFVYVFFLVGYFSYFGFVPEIYSLGGANAADLGGVLRHYMRQVFGVREFALIVTAGLFFFLLPRRKLSKTYALFLAFPTILFGVNYAQFGSPSQTDGFGNASVIRRFGLPTFFYISAQEWASFKSGYLAEETPFPGKLAGIIYPAPQTDQQSAALPDAVKRVVLIQIESFDREAINARLNGLPVMPFVSELAASSCQEYTNFHTTKSLGGSSDAEFSVATGRLPSPKRQAIRYTDFGKTETLYDILSENGVTSYFAHNNNIGFYGRNFAYTQLSNLNYTFLRPGEVVDERAFALDTLSSAIAASDRFFYYFFNFQSHGPYQGYTAGTKEKFGLSEASNIEEDYMATMHDVDQTIADMFAVQLSGFDLGENLFIVTADHPSYLHGQDTPLGVTHVPMLVCHSGFTGQKIEKVASTVDLFPTLLDAFDIPGQETAIADSLLKNAPNVVLFPNGRVLYRQEDATLKTKMCGDSCRKFFDYTHQLVRIGN